MKRIIDLMNEKNHYLEKFYALNEKELANFMKDDFGNLEGFYETRERILEVIKYIDGQMDLEQNRNPHMAATSGPREKRAVLEALTIKDEYVARILEQDLQVLACIESAKNSIIRELQDIRKGKKAVTGYRSPNFAQRLDEKA
ncbi:MAG: flagellar protein FliT [Bdellovibrionaceae bacterium]|nr:flagellar protein FliT [Pseudobdellovibrionaceae bacterium]